MTTTLTKKINNLIAYFKNIKVGLHDFYVLNIYIKFCAIKCYLPFDS